MKQLKCVRYVLNGVDLTIYEIIDRLSEVKVWAQNLENTTLTPPFDLYSSQLQENFDILANQRGSLKRATCGLSGTIRALDKSVRGEYTVQLRQERVKLARKCTDLCKRCDYVSKQICELHDVDLMQASMHIAKAVAGYTQKLSEGFAQLSKDLPSPTPAGQDL